MSEKFAAAELGREGHYALQDAEDNHQAVLRLLQGAKRILRLFSRDLDPRIFDHVDVCDAISALARRHPQSRVLLLVFDAESPLRNGHRLVTLSQKLSSKIEARVVADEYTHLPFSFMTVDDRGLLYRSLASEFAGEVDFNQPIGVKDRVKQFDEIWGQSRVASEWRRLHI
jgi:hypothetical protein